MDLTAAELKAIEDIARAIDETPGNARTLAFKGVFKKISHGRYDLIESVRNYIEANKKGWRGRGRLKRCSCGSPLLPFGGLNAEEPKK